MAFFLRCLSTCLLVGSLFVAVGCGSQPESVDVNDDVKKQQQEDEDAANEEELNMPDEDGSTPKKNKPKRR